MAAEVVEALAFGDVSIPRAFVIQRDGRDVVLVAGLIQGLVQLSRGHYDLQTEVLERPTDANGQLAEVRAVVTIFDPADGRVVRVASGTGDASPTNVPRHMVPHLRRLAETRAVGRALRHLGLGAGMVALEELGEDGPEPAGAERTPDAARSARPAPTSSAPAVTTEHILIAGKPYTRQEVLVTYRRRLEEAKAAGLVIGEVDVVPPESAPLASLVAKGQEIRRRLEARASGK